MSNWNDLNAQQQGSPTQAEQLDPRIQSAGIDDQGRLVLTVNENVLRFRLPEGMNLLGTTLETLSNKYLHEYEDALAKDRLLDEAGQREGRLIGVSPLVVKHIPGDKVSVTPQDPRMPVLELPLGAWSRIDRQNSMSPRTAYLTALHEQQEIADVIHNYHANLQTRPYSVDVKRNGDYTDIKAVGREGGKMPYVAHVMNDVYDRLIAHDVFPKDIYVMSLTGDLPHTYCSQKDLHEGSSLMSGVKDTVRGMAQVASDFFERLTSGGNQQSMSR